MLQDCPLYAYIPASEVAQLRARGVEFEQYEPEEIGGMSMKDGIATGGGAKAAWFRDSEGNIMGLIQELDRH